jgi:UTP--glucose-1-phosphate uridylyltransferase
MDPLALHRFDEATFLTLQAALRAGTFRVDENIVHDTLGVPDNFLVPTPKHRGAGSAAIAAGDVALVILNGGMATRFGGAVKGIVEVAPGESFLQRKLRGVTAPVFVMNSFATDQPTRKHLGGRVHYAIQGISRRLTPEGEPFAGVQAYYAPGHGDVFAALAHCAAFRAFAAVKGRVVMIVNVDNVGATLDAEIIGAHLATGLPLTVEVVPRDPKDAGGIAAVRAGKPQIIEGFRLPRNFDFAGFHWFNTNTLIMDARAAMARYDLSWIRADKVVEGRPAVQFERLIAEVTAFVECAFLQVDRARRFRPVKTQEDLRRLQQEETCS